jgi:Flp pilus assembly protein TadD
MLEVRKNNEFFRDYWLGCLLLMLSLGFQQRVALSQDDHAGVRLFSRGEESAVLITSNPALGTDLKVQAARFNEEGVELVLQGKQAEGAAKLKQANALDPANATVLYNLAGVFLSQGDAPKAVSVMEKATSLQPDDMPFLHRLAESYTASNDLNKAVLTYERIVEQDSGANEVLLKLGTLYGISEQWERAEETLKKVRESMGNDPRLLNSLGSILIIRGKHKEAVDVLEKARTKVKDAKNSIALGIAYESLGNPARALVCYHQAQEFGERGEDLQRHIAELEQQGTSQTGKVRPAK